ncbi:flavodoxin family protein [Fonticella tunisiensis]|uniref:NADPH-dependent FMN reductase n=1 Tax=Fonticella tunisiensis TaxID=1096341 RepID=A0A4R7KP81_9CLOT|nr:flavodoxin family protein [Fonticella tunisiensis]TDT60929.1 NADPH-dependent FMN reductase [Fonticella tunisiensis]
MKVVAVSCSPRVGGSCDILVDEFLRGVRDGHKEVSIDKYKVANMKINGCMGCYGCKSEKGCVQRDDMQVIYRDIYDADVILFASPIYMGYITGIGKSFLERMFAFSKGHYDLNLPSGKRSVLILTQSHQREDAYRRVADEVINIFNSYGINTVGRIIAAGIDRNTESIDDNILNIAYQSGLNI